MRQRAPRYDLPKAAPGRLRLVQQFVNTTDHEHTRELLATPAALEGWLAAEGFVVRSVGPAALRRAHAVRDGLRELVVTGTAGEALEAAADRARLTLDLEAGELRPRASGVDGALGTILAAVYDALHDGSWERFKACRNCGWAFWDESRNRSAAWCSMQLCGNRLKVRRHRAKLTPRSSP
jgi:predicted RNA-binding Zn ribbon-like protein